MDTPDTPCTCSSDNICNTCAELTDFNDEVARFEAEGGVAASILPAEPLDPAPAPRHSLALIQSDERTVERVCYVWALALQHVMNQQQVNDVDVLAAMRTAFRGFIHSAIEEKIADKPVVAHINRQIVRQVLNALAVDLDALTIPDPFVH